MKVTSTLFASGMAMLATASPLARRANEMCGDWDNVVVDDFTLYNNLWGKGAASSGNQCTTLDGNDGTTIKWHSTWSWAGGENSIKSFPNVVVKTEAVPISQIKSIPSKWTWKYEGKDLVSDVAYDLFTSNEKGGDERYELMVWLANINAGPIASEWDAQGNAKSIGSTTIAGQKWNVYKGPNGDMTVFSFLPADGKQIKSFNGDVNLFFSYLIKEQGLPSSQFLKSVGAGTEPTLGKDATFTTTGYSVKVNYS